MAKRKDSQHVSIVRKTVVCHCGRPFKVRSESGATECWPCHLVTNEAAYQAHMARYAARVAASPPDDSDPFIGVGGLPLGSQRFTGKWSPGATA